jgi:hypothetical protein
VKIKTVYFDMDGVLADLPAAVLEYAQTEHGLEGDLSEVRSSAQSVHHYYLLRREAIGMYASFATLPPNQLDPMRALMKRIHKAGIEVEILTSYGLQDPTEMGDEVHRGKADFLRDHYLDLFQDGTITRFNGVSKSFQKAFFARPGAVLLDDWARNINEWRATGAPAVHYHRDRHEECVHELLQLLGLEAEPWG